MGCVTVDCGGSAWFHASHGASAGAKSCAIQGVKASHKRAPLMLSFSARKRHHILHANNILLILIHVKVIMKVKRMTIDR